MPWDISNYNTNPALNTAINGTDISEGSAAAGYNDALRQIMADIKTWTNTYAVTYPIAINKGGTGQTTAGAAFNAIAASGGTMGANLVFTGKGVHLYHNASTMDGGKVFFQAAGADPMSNKGDIVFEW
jgi:hypothetical protein